MLIRLLGLVVPHVIAIVVFKEFSKIMTPFEAL
jgi:ABC-type Fe3+-siderophore transport system permease subunit